MEQAIRSVSLLARQSGGMIFHQEMTSMEEESKTLQLSADSLLVVTAYSPQAALMVRVPSEQLEDFMFRLAALGYYTPSSQTDIQDKSLEYLEKELEQKNRKAVLDSHPFTGIKTIAVRDGLIERQIRKRMIDADLHYSTLSLSLFQNSLVRKEMMANNHLDAYDLPFTTRLENALRSGWEGFLEFLLV